MVLEVGPDYQSLSEAIQLQTGENPYLCYQCQKCTSGCPVAEDASVGPHQVMRALQLGQLSTALESDMVWLCVSCQICSSRCPQGIEIATVMDALKIMALNKGLKPPVPEVQIFSEAGLRTIKWFGRMYEVGLILEFNLRTRNLIRDLPLGIDLLRARRLGLIPPLVRGRHRKIGLASRTPAAGTVAYYPGCSLESAASDYDKSVRAVASKLGIGLEEPEGWVCCGSKPAPWNSSELAAELAMRNIGLVAESGHHTVTVPCAACFSRFRHTIHEVERSEELAKHIEEVTGYRYDGVRVQHVVDTLVEMVGPRKVAGLATRKLNGLKVACYYGCLVTRPGSLTGADNVENPLQMERMLKAVGAEPVDWPGKTECCGGSHTLARTEIALGLTEKLLAQATAADADVVVVACPMCHLNLDARQSQIRARSGMRAIPVLYFTQLLGLALGLAPKDLDIGKLLTDARPLLRAKGLLT